MSIRSILVHAEANDASDRRVRLAQQLADLFGASLTGLGAEAFDPVFVTGYAGLEGTIIESIRERVSADLPAARARFESLTRPGADVSWIAEEDYPDKMLALHARGADLIVASRPARGEGAAYAASPAHLVMEAGVPVLLAADGDQAFSGEQVIVGWKDARESRRAITDALPFLKRAKAVTIVTVAGDAGAEDRSARRDLSMKLSGHGVEPTFVVIAKGRSTVADALEACAAERGADLIVAGAYGHSRLREWMLGGVTEDLLAASSRFVLFSH